MNIFENIEEDLHYALYGSIGKQSLIRIEKDLKNKIERHKDDKVKLEELKILSKQFYKFIKKYNIKLDCEIKE